MAGKGCGALPFARRCAPAAFFVRVSMRAEDSRAFAGRAPVFSAWVAGFNR